MGTKEVDLSFLYGIVGKPIGNSWFDNESGFWEIVVHTRQPNGVLVLSAHEFLDISMVQHFSKIYREEGIVGLQKEIYKLRDVNFRASKLIADELIRNEFYEL